MMRLLHRCVVLAVVFLIAPATARGQSETWVEREAERAERAAERQAERAERAAERAAEQAERAGERLEARTERLEQQAERLGEQIGTRAEQLGERIGTRAERLGERMQERAGRLQDRIERRIDRGFGSSRGAHVVFGKSYRLAEGARATEGIVVVGGNATIDGTAEGDVVVFGGELRIGPTAIIHGDVAAVGGRLDRDPAARIDGDVDVAKIDWGAWNWDFDLPRVGPIWWEGAAFAFTIGRFVLVMFLSILFVAVAPQWTSSIASRLRGGPVGSAAAGIVAQILAAPALVLLVVALIVTIIGIPLLAGLPLLVAAFGLLWVGGYATVAGVVGARVRGAEWSSNGVGAFDVIVGSFVLSGLSIFGQMLAMSGDWVQPTAVLVRGTGWTIEYIAWTIGLGAALTAWRRPGGFDSRVVPPVIPPVPTPSPTAI